MTIVVLFCLAQVSDNKELQGDNCNLKTGENKEPAISPICSPQQLVFGRIIYLFEQLQNISTSFTGDVWFESGR